MPEASDKGSQPYRKAVRFFEMAGKATPHIKPCLVGKGHKQHMSPTQGQAYIIGSNSIPAIYFPSLREQWPLVRRTHRHGCMAGYHCLMPNGIFLSQNTILTWLLYCIYSFEMPTELLWKIPTKTCRGKVMKEKLNCVKTESSLFIHHSSFCESLGFTPRKVSFDRAKGYVSSHERWPFTRRKVSFRAPKPYLSQIQIL